MNRSKDYLNDKQVAVLEWIKADCPDGVYAEGFTHRIIARALEARGLVRISGQGRTWAAEVTSVGAEWTSPVPPVPTEDARDQLLQRVMDAGGQLELGKGELTPELRNLVESTMLSPTRPRGQKLEIKSQGSWGDRHDSIIFLPYPADLIDLQPVPIVQRLSNPHPVVFSYLKDPDWSFVTMEHIPRAARLLQSIVDEALRRGMSVSPPAPLEGSTARGGRWPHPPSPVFDLVYKGRRFGVSVSELSAPGGGKLPYTHDHLRSPRWFNQRHYKFMSTGRLLITCCGGYKDGRWAKVESILPELFRDVTLRDLELSHQEAEKARAAAVRELEWEAAMAQARERYDTEARYARFREQSDRWETLQRRRAFLEAARQRLVDYGGPDRVAVARQLDFVEEQINRLDPLRNLSTLVVDVPEPRADDLRPYLGKWSPHGPSASY